MLRSVFVHAVLVLLALGTLAGCGGGGGGGGGPATWFVDADEGDDAGAGTAERPFKTITHALSVATDGDVVRVAPGLYNSRNEEVFPLVVPPGVTLLGNADRLARGAGVLVSGHAETDIAVHLLVTLHATIVPMEGSAIIGLQLANTQVASTPGSLYAVVAAAHSGASVQACDLNGGQFGILFLNQSRGLRVEGSRIRNSAHGMYFHSDGGLASVVENTVVEGNRYGVFVASPGGAADLGGGFEGGRGGNTFAGNREADLRVEPDVQAPVIARDNRWDNAPDPTRHEGPDAPPGTDVWVLEDTVVVDTTGAQAVDPTIKQGPLAPDGVGLGR